jgi:hypothetical protein
VTGNFYVGVHSTMNLEDGYLGSGFRLQRSIKKHGKENHIREVLEFFETREELVKREREVVNEETIADPKCMNLKKGGEGGFLNDEHRSKFQRGGTLAASKSASHGDKSRKVLANFRREGKNAGSKNFKGKRPSRETLSRVRAGEGNSQFGKCWVIKEKQVRSIKFEELEKYLKDGWKRGRK